MEKKTIKYQIVFGSIITLILIIAVSSSLFGITFEFNDHIGDTYNISSYVYQYVYLDEELNGEYDYKYEGILDVVDKIGTTSKLKGTYHAYIKPAKSTDPYQLINEDTVHTEFMRRQNGEMEVDKSYLYPTVRDLPKFPEHDVKVGEEWQAKALEIMDLRSLGAKRPYHIPLDVKYKYVSNELYQEKKVAVFFVKYYFEYDLFEKPVPGSDDTRPIKLSGLFEGNYYWDIKNSTPLFYEAETVFTYILKNAQVLEIRTDEYGEVKKITDYESDDIDVVDDDRKGEIAEDIESELRDEELSDDFIVTEKDNGVSINLGDILFDYNSSELKEEYIQKLDKIVKILKKYENFKIDIEGHTDSIGSDNFNKELSKERADSVEDYFIIKGIKEDSLTTEGYGEENPIGDNDTEEGRSKNRRVEIIIVTNGDDDE